MFKADNQTTVNSTITSPEKTTTDSLPGIHAMPKTSETSMRLWFMLGGGMLLLVIILFLLLI